MEVLPIHKHNCLAPRFEGAEMSFTKGCIRLVGLKNEKKEAGHLGMQRSPSFIVSRRF